MHVDEEETREREGRGWREEEEDGTFHTIPLRVKEQKHKNTQKKEIHRTATHRVGYSSSGRPMRAYEPSFSYSSGLDGTRVRYSAGMIWSVSMFCVLCVVCGVCLEGEG
jgi:hypothetical protein